MITEELKTQIFKTPEQWGSGLFYRLDALEKGGITLYSTPAFTEWIIQLKNGIYNPAGLVVENYGQIYVFDSDPMTDLCRLCRYDCETKNLEKLSYISCNNAGQKKECPKRILLSKYTLWVNDTMNKRVLAFSREDYQITNVINKLKDEIIEPVDIGLDECGHLYVLMKKSNKYKIAKYDEYGHLKTSYELNLGEPVGLASGKKNFLYVIDRAKNQLIKYKDNGSSLDQDFAVDLSNDSISKLQSSGIVIDGKGNIFLSDSLSDFKGLIHQFDSDGSSLGIVKGFTESVQGFAVDSKGDLYVSCNKGICKLCTENTFTKEEGTYYSKTLDSGIRECQWHRIALEADVPPKAVVEISYILSDLSDLQSKIDGKIVEEKISKQKKVDEIEDLLKEKKLIWSKPERFSSNSSNFKEKDTTLLLKSDEPVKTQKYMLIRNNKGRYLWLKVKLLTFDEKVSPTITQMKIHYPRISYLRYLPAIYQEDPASSEFLERFLSIFETVSGDLETRISQIQNYFDPATVPQKFLNWLASWLNVALEEDWQEEKKRQLIKEAYILYKQKGTRAGIERMIEIYTGKKPVILEHSKMEKPMILKENGNLRLGFNSLLIETPFSGLRLGDEAILGRITLRDSVRSPEELFLPMAHRFTITLDLSDDEKILFEKQLRRILDDEKPAHTMYDLRFSGSGGAMETSGEIITKLDYYRRLTLGTGAIIGTVVIITNGERGGKIEQSSIVGVDTELV